MISQNTSLQNRLRTIAGPGVLDVLLFGSAARGKQKPNDTDVLVLFKEKVDKEVEYRIRKEVEKYYPHISIISKTQASATEDSFDAREGVLFEGTSLITGDSMSGKYGFAPFGMYKYDFLDWSNLMKTRFYHALNGRDGKSGVFASLGCIKLSDSLVLVPLGKIEEFRDFLSSWKIPYKYIPLLIPQRLARKHILEG